MGWLSGFDNSNESNSTNNIDDIATTNASYGNGSPVNINLSDLQIRGTDGGAARFTLAPTINVTDGGAIEAALGLAERSQEVQSQTALEFAEIARQAGQPAGALIENITKYGLAAIAVLAVVFVAWKSK